MSDIHILVPPIKDEPGDDIACIASSGGLEEELDDLNAVVLKEIKPFTIKLQAQVNKVEKDITTVERATECSHNKIVGLTKEMADLSKSLQTMKLRVDAMQAGSRTPWLRRDDGQRESAPLAAFDKRLQPQNNLRTQTMRSNRRLKNTRIICSMQRTP